MDTVNKIMNVISNLLLFNRSFFIYVCVLTALMCAAGLPNFKESDTLQVFAQSETEGAANAKEDGLVFESHSAGGMQDKPARKASTRFERVGASVIRAANFSVWEDGVLYDTAVLEDGTLSVNVDMPMTEKQLDEALPQASTTYLTAEEQAALDETLDWYTLFLFDYQSRNLALYDAVTVRLANPNPHVLSVNVVVETADEVGDQPNHSVEQDSQAIVQPSYLWLSADGQTAFEVVAMEGNRFEIPAGFAGQLYLPFASFGAQGSNPFTWSDTLGLSFHFPSETGRHQFEVNDLHLLRNSLADIQDFLQTPSLIGNFNLLLPKAGSMLEVYQASDETLATGRPYEFSLAENYAGVSVSPEGYLELEAALVDTDEISLQIRDQASGTFSRQLVQLTPLTELNPALADLSVPLSSEIAAFETEKFDVWYKQLPFIRLIVGLGAFGLIGLFVYWWETERVVFSEEFVNKLEKGRHHLVIETFAGEQFSYLIVVNHRGIKGIAR